MSNPEGEEWFEQIKQFLREDDKIGAIKLYREVTRVGLKEGKDAVEKLERILIADQHQCPNCGGYKTTFRKVKDKTVGVRYRSSCQLCGYQWYWKLGDSRSEVNVRPDLIGKGAQKLEEERQQKELAAWFWLQKQQRK